MPVEITYVALCRWEAKGVAKTSNLQEVQECWGKQKTNAQKLDPGARKWDREAKATEKSGTN